MNTSDEYFNDDEKDYDSPIFSNDFIYCINKKGDIMSCGMKVESGLLKKKHSLGKGLEGNYVFEVQDDKDDIDEDELSHALFTKHGVPLGVQVQSYPYRHHKHIYEEEDHEEIDDELYDALMELANESKQRTSKRLTKKLRKGNSQRKSKKRGMRIDDE